MRTALCLVLAVGTAAHAQVDEAAKARLQAMADTIKQATSITYSSVNKGSGGFFAMIPEHKADVAMLRNPQNGEWNQRISGSRLPAAGQPGLDFILVAKGNLRTWTDDSAKVVYERPSWNANAEQVTAAMQATVRELWEPQRLERDLQAGTIKSEPAQVVEGVPCEVVLVDPGQQQPQTRYFIASTDKLPRKVEQILGESVGSQAWTLSNVQLNPPLPESLFKVDVPEGYTFVPSTPPPAPATTTPATTTPAVKQRTTGSTVGDLAPQFTLSAADGTPVTLGMHMGNVVVLEFWGTWSLQSKKAAPALHTLTEKYKDEPVKVFALAVREASNENPKKFVADSKHSYTLLLQADSAAKEYKVKVYPTYFVIGKEGEIVARIDTFDEKTIPAIEEAIDIALGKKPPKPTPPAPSKEQPPPTKTEGEQKPTPETGDNAGKPAPRGRDGGR